MSCRTLKETAVAITAAAFVVSLLAGAAASETLFTSSGQALTEGAGGAALAKLYVAAPLDVLERQDGAAHVAVKGWARAGAERALFALPGKWILLAAVDRNSVSRLREIGEWTDPETSVMWKQLELDGWVDSTMTVTSVEPIWDKAWELFSTRCTVCHVRRVPEHYTANQWASHLKVMGPRTGLPEESQSLILTFLQYHASDTTGTNP
ncbi:hypothetical protein [Tropicimonas sp.]|uniref:hypothetical protein n=1 Tax=Tropicimonas sp. TaxID=2067044 RepID=UPI003A89C5F0